MTIPYRHGKSFGGMHWKSSHESQNSLVMLQVNKRKTTNVRLHCVSLTCGSGPLAGVLNHPASRQFTRNLPPRLQEALNTDAVRATTDDYDSARIYLAKWAAGLAARSDQDTPIERRYRHVGIWGHGWEEETALGVFEVLNVRLFHCSFFLDCSCMFIE